MSDRYARHSLIPEWDQDKLTSAMVIIVGMGALGNEAARILAMAGVGNLILCDPDVIEVSNLSRTVLFRPSDIGRLKVVAAAETLGELNPEINLRLRSQPLVHGVGLGEIRDANLILSCLDSHSARLQLAGRCQLVQAPYLDGGTHPWGGEVRPYMLADGPCYGCSLSASERGIPDVPWSCLDTREETPRGAAIPSSALVGTWMGAIAIRFLLGLSYPEGILKIDVTRGTTSIVQPKRDPDCPLHHPIGLVTKIDVGVEDTMLKLRRTLPEGAIPLAWEAVQYRVECSHCGFAENRWGLTSRDNCPRCQHGLRAETTLELDRAPENSTLSSLGIPHQEILPVRVQDTWQWFELQKVMVE